VIIEVVDRHQVGSFRMSCNGGGKNEASQTDEKRREEEKSYTLIRLIGFSNGEIDGLMKR
jgi:hypothetical protein